MKEFSDHIKWLMDRAGDAVQAKLALLAIDLDLDQAMHYIIDADPSVKKGAVDWLVRVWLEDGFLWEDLQGGFTSKVSETLQWFAQHRKNITGSGKNLASYKTLADLYLAVEPFLKLETPVPGSREIKRSEKDRALEESIVLRKDEDTILVAPRTEYASQWWGRGTRWCTAATNHNMFEHYNKTAPLVIAIFPNGLQALDDKANDQTELGEQKFQIWVEESETVSGQISFMDSADRTVELSVIQSNWPSFEPIIQWAWQRNPKAIQWFPEELINSEMVDRALSIGNHLLEYIPKRFITKELCEKIFTRTNVPLKHIPEEFLTEEVCNREFENNYFSIEWIPHRLQNSEMILTSLTFSFSSIKHVNPNLINEKMLLEVIDTKKRSHAKYLKPRYPVVSNYLDPESWERIPSAFKTPQLGLAYAQVTPYVVKYMKPEDITVEIALLAVKNKNYSLIKHLPKHAINKEVIALAVENMSDYNSQIQWLSPDMLDKELCMKMVSKSSYLCGAVAKIIPEELWDKDIVQAVLEKDCTNVRYLPSKFAIDELWMTAFKEHNWIYQHFPIHLKRSVTDPYSGCDRTNMGSDDSIVTYLSGSREKSFFTKDVLSDQLTRYTPMTMPEIGLYGANMIEELINAENILIGNLNPLGQNKSKPIKKGWNSDDLEGLKVTKKTDEKKLGF